MIEIPFMAVELAIACAWVIVRIVACVRKGSVDWRREAQLLLLWLCIAVIVRFTFFAFSKVNGHVQPLRFDASRLWPLKANFVPIVNLLHHDSLRDLLINIPGNIAMFIPLGIVLPFLFDRLDSFGKVVGIGAGFSLGIEIVQLLFFERATDVDDLILNALGCAIGYGVYRLIARASKRGEVGRSRELRAGKHSRR